jgi:hypothetical protein
MSYQKQGKSIPVRKNIRNSQELFCVLKGKVELDLGDERIMLLKGEGIHYWSNHGKQMILGKSAVNAIAI